MTAFDSSRREMLKRTGAAAGAIAGGSLLPDVPSALARAGSTGAQMRNDAEMHTDQASSPVSVALRVNGAEHSLVLDPRTTLLDALREHLHLTGAKKGCGLGQCGACTVLLDGKRVKSCLSLAALVEGHEITTIEGVSRGDQLHPLQAAFIERDAFQCGYCTAGQIMSGIACINEGHAGAAHEIREWMSGNICRCGAYEPIVLAIQDVARAVPPGSGG